MIDKRVIVSATIVLQYICVCAVLSFGEELRSLELAGEHHDASLHCTLEGSAADADAHEVEDADEPGSATIVDDTGRVEDALPISGGEVELHAGGNITLKTHFGTVTYYSDRNGYEARCGRCGPIDSGGFHGAKCILSKTCNGSDSKAAQGRPLGLISSWLMYGVECENKEQHKSYRPTRMERVVARLQFQEWYPEGFALLEEKERCPREDEDDEPVSLP